MQQLLSKAGVELQLYQLPSIGDNVKESTNC